jgi:hypothetical protein
MEETAQESAPVENLEVSAPEVEAPREVEATSRGAVERAFAAVEKSSEPVKTEEVAVTEDKETQPIESVKFDTAPNRFSADAKAAWQQAPEPVRAEITRAVTELENGLNDYRQKWEPLKEFDTIAKENGTDIKTALTNYVGIERLIASDPIKGLGQVCENMGLSLRAVAEHVLGQEPDQASAGQEQTIRELRQEIQSIRQEMNGVSTSIKSRDEQTIMNEVLEFAKDKPRFGELERDIAFFLEAGRAKNLQEAFEMADRFNPAAQTVAVTPPLKVQTNKGQLSMTGAPSSGSTPQNPARPVSAREALSNAFARAGL